MSYSGKRYEAYIFLLNILLHAWKKKRIRESWRCACIDREDIAFRPGYGRVKVCGLSRYFYHTVTAACSLCTANNDSVMVEIMAGISPVPRATDVARQEMIFLQRLPRSLRVLKVLRASFSKAVRGIVRTFCGACSHLTRCVFSRWG